MSLHHLRSVFNFQHFTYLIIMSRYLILSDIHANLEALEAVLEKTRGRWDSVLVLGDSVDYGPDPDSVVELLQNIGATAILGNHDAVMIDRYDFHEFREAILPVVLWTKNNISPKTRSYLEGLPLTLKVESGLFVHANTQNPLAGYILTNLNARTQFQATDEALVFFGHTHFCIVYKEDERGLLTSFTPQDGEMLNIRKGRFLVNPGSVGQPRNHDPRAFYVIWDTQENSIEFYRTPYPFEKTQEKMRRLGFPSELVQRLTHGV